MLVGGMIPETLFTLFVVLSIYLLVAKDHGRYREQETLIEVVEKSA